MSNPAVFTFDAAKFKAAFPAFAAVDNNTLQGYWDSATCYVSPANYGWLSGDCRLRALNLMTAHLAKLAEIIATGQLPGLEQSATIDKISVTMTPPPLKNQFHWWLSLTPYGQQLLALLMARSAGGFYIGGLPERSAFRKVGGLY